MSEGKQETSNLSLFLFLTMVLYNVKQNKDHVTSIFTIPSDMVSDMQF
jgi:hypothetical protein